MLIISLLIVFGIFFCLENIKDSSFQGPGRQIDWYVPISDRLIFFKGKRETVGFPLR
jgi:hypothetical protein